MRRSLHGQTIYRSQPVGMAPFGGAATKEAVPKALNVTPPTVGYMFPELQKDNANRLPESPVTLMGLDALGRAMANEPSNNNGPIPAAYTYFGQFIDHDITKTSFHESLRPADGSDPVEGDKVTPIDASRISTLVFNDRTMRLELDSVYEGEGKATIGPDGRFQLMDLSVSNNAAVPPIKTHDRAHDLPRLPMDFANPARDRAARIGDPRNDENLLVAQTHVAFLRSHNRLIEERKMSLDQARTAIRRRYQHAVLHDFLRRVCDRDVLHDVHTNGPRFLQPTEGTGPFMPVEFSAAAYRFGHSMIRAEYDHNTSFGPEPAKVRGTLELLFTFTALSGNIPNFDEPNEPFETLPDNWTIDWTRFFGKTDVDPSANPARLIDAHLTPPLANLPEEAGKPFAGVMKVLAARNLRRGYLLGLPTGQAVAGALGLPPLDRQVLVDAISGAAKDDLDAIEAAGLFDRTPLWFYILAEAGDQAGPKGHHLGPVGSRIVAETLWTCAQNAEDSVITTPPTAEELATGEFTLKGLIRIGVDGLFRNDL